MSSFSLTSADGIFCDPPLGLCLTETLGPSQPTPPGNIPLHPNMAWAVLHVTLPLPSVTPTTTSNENPNPPSGTCHSTMPTRSASLRSPTRCATRSNEATMMQLNLTPTNNVALQRLPFHLPTTKIPQAHSGLALRPLLYGPPTTPRSHPHRCPSLSLPAQPHNPLCSPLNKSTLPP